MKEENEKKNKKRKRQGKGLRNRKRGERDALYSMIQDEKLVSEDNLKKAKGWSS